MKRGRSTGTPTLAEAARFEAIKELGCLVAHILGMEWVPCEIHHMTSGGKHGQKRRGHEFSIGLNSWSHRGAPFNGWTSKECEELFGPSYARQPRAFREMFGRDDELLSLQNQLLEERTP